MSAEHRRMMSIREAATYLGVSTTTVRRYIASGRLRAYRLDARLIRLDEADVDALLRQLPPGELAESDDE